MNSNQTPKLSIVIPAFNEAARLPSTLKKLAQFLAAQPYVSEVIVVDDGSTDRTLQVCYEMQREMPTLSVISSSPNRGKGFAVRVGVLEAKGDIVVMFDADSSTPATELPKLLAFLALGATQIAIGSRYVSGAEVEARPWWRQNWSRLCNFVIQQTLVPGVQDTQCGFKAFTREVANELFSRATVNGWAFDLEILALAHQRGYKVIEVPVTWKDDQRSRVNPWRDFTRVIHEAILIKRRLQTAR